MLDFLLVTGSLYFMYHWGIRQMVRSRIANNRWAERTAYLLFLGIGCTLSLYLSEKLFFPQLEGWPLPVKCLIPTAAGIWLGEILYARNLAVTLRLLKQLGKSEERAHD